MTTATHPQSERPLETTVAVSRAVREAARFDRKLVSFDAGLLAAVPVVAVLTFGIAIGRPVWGVTMGAGAMLVGIAWRVTGGRPPLALMATDAVAMAISTFVGSVTGSVTWLHIIVLCLWGLMAGLLVAVGNRGGAVGTQSIIALVVFGRFSQPAAQALGLATLVLAGGLAQVVFLSVVRWPLPLRNQRAATAAAYRGLAALAAASDEASTLPAAEAIDDAEASLASPTLFGDAALTTLRSLVNEAFRMRVQIMAVHALLRQLRAAGDEEAGAPDSPVRRALATTSSALDTAALAIQGDEDAFHRLLQRSAELDAEVKAYSGGEPGSPALHMDRRLAALAGQVRAVAALSPAAGKDGGLRTRRPYHRTNHPLDRLRTDLELIRANMSIHSPAGRHALRLAVIVPVTALIARELPIPRSYWMVVAAATILRPEFGATFTRGAERALGTCLGVALAGAIAVTLPPGRRRDDRPRRHAGVGGLFPVPGQLRGRVHLHHGARGLPAQRDHPGHARHGHRSAGRHAHRRRDRAHRLCAVADLGTHLGLAIARRARRGRAHLRRRRAHRRGRGAPPRRPADARAGATGTAGPDDGRVHGGPFAV